MTTNEGAGLRERIDALRGGAGMSGTQPCPRCDGSGVVADDRVVGASLRAKREAAGRSLRDQARSMALSVSYLSDLELGRRTWRGELIERYTAALA